MLKLILQLVCVAALFVSYYHFATRTRSWFIAAAILALFAVGAFGVANAAPSLTVSVIYDIDVVADRDAVNADLLRAGDTIQTQTGVPVSFVADVDLRLTQSTQVLSVLMDVVAYRDNVTAFRESSITIFITRRDLHIGSTHYAGYTFIGGAWSEEGAIALAYQTGWSNAENMAHEIGHAMGAPHDGKDACKSTPAYGYIMSEEGSGATLFSPCSLTEIAKRVDEVKNERAAAPSPPRPSGGGGGFSLIWVLVFVGVYVEMLRRSWTK